MVIVDYIVVEYDYCLNFVNSLKCKKVRHLLRFRGILNNGLSYRRLFEHKASHFQASINKNIKLIILPAQERLPMINKINMSDSLCIHAFL